jgi:L-glyceraldehyde 3-phosphate reductase
MAYLAAEARYNTMTYNRLGRSGLKLPAISLGWWYNIGGVDTLENGRAIARRAFDAGITHFDLANNYGPPPGSAEENFGLLLRQDFQPYRNELIISTKAGYDMWPGPYGEWGSRKYLLASLDDSLKRLGLDYVDIFYHHRPDRILRELGTPCLIHQPRYNLLDRWIEGGLTEVLDEEGIGCIVFSPLAQGQLTDRYLDGIPAGARASKTLRIELTAEDVDRSAPRARQLNALAMKRGQSLAQMAIAWVLRLPVVTSALIGASSVRQLENNLAALNNLKFSRDELAEIDRILQS